MSIGAAAIIDYGSRDTKRLRIIVDKPVIQSIAAGFFPSAGSYTWLAGARCRCDKPRLRHVPAGVLTWRSD